VPVAPLQDYLLLTSLGDRAAFTSLYSSTAPVIYRAVQRLLVDPSQAEEVTQEVFVEVWQKSAQYQSARAGVMSWMLMIARRRAIDRVRASQASRERDHRVGVRSVEIDWDSVAESAESRAEGARVRIAMDQLTKVQRQAIELSFFAELSYIEISAQLQVPVGTVKTRIRDAILRLQGALEIVR
jgi:RNA polymerase sigma-70 factor (ECF subfamily)